MKKLLFQNSIVNIVLGALMIGLILTAYFLGWMTDFFGILIGILVILVSVKRFFVTFKTVSHRDATAVLVIEILIDLFCGFMLIVYSEQNKIGLYLGIAIYARGFAYILINYLATRKGNLLQYFVYIGLLTIGSYLMFGGNTFLDEVEIIILVLVIIFGSLFLGFGIYDVVKKFQAKKAKAPKKIVEPEVKKTPIEEVKDLPKTVTTTVTKTVVKTEPIQTPQVVNNTPVKTTPTKTAPKTTTTTTKTTPKTKTTTTKKPTVKAPPKEEEKKE